MSVSLRGLFPEDGAPKRPSRSTCHSGSVSREQESRAAVRRADQPGDLGWVVLAHGEIYAHQLGWDTDFEALVARIVADYAAHHDPEREAAWIAEVDGERAGCIFLVADDEPGVAKLRILLVTPAARGLGVGTLLVETYLAFAREPATDRSRWTNDVLVSARRIYEAHGFVLTEEEPHHSFGHDLVGQTGRSTCADGYRRPLQDELNRKSLVDL